MNKTIVMLCFSMFSIVVFSQGKEFAELKEKAIGEDKEAQYILGMEYLNQESLMFDKTKGFYWLEKSAEQGYDSAQYNIGAIYYGGYIVPKDEKKSLYWFEKSAEQYFLPGLLNAGIMYNEGIGTSVDKQKAVDFVMIACLLSDSDSAFFKKAKRYLHNSILND